MPIRATVNRFMPKTFIAKPFRLTNSAQTARLLSFYQLDAAGSQFLQNADEDFLRGRDVVRKPLGARDWKRSGDRKIPLTKSGLVVAMTPRSNMNVKKQGDTPF